ncbi:MAG: hypothetical protein ACJ8BW_12370 [Ktedonobacteraceae bacterium]
MCDYSNRTPINLYPIITSIHSGHNPIVRSDPKWQQDELHVLGTLDEQMRWALAHSQRAQMYPRERGIPLKIALATGVGYVPATLLNRPEMCKQ